MEQNETHAAALLCSASALSAVTRERDDLLDMADMIANSHPAMSADDALALAEESYRNA